MGAITTRARAFAESWGAEFKDYGLRGHINADSGLGALALIASYHRFACDVPQRLGGRDESLATVR